MPSYTIDTDWGAQGAQWTGLEVQNFIKNQIRSLISRATALEEQVSSLTGSTGSSATSLQTQIDTLQNSLQTAQNNISTLQTNLSSAQSSIQTNQGNISSLQSSASSLQSSVNTLQTNMTNAQASIQTITSNTGASTLTSLASVPINKNLAVVSIGANASFSLASMPSAGNEIHVIVCNTSENEITVTLPNSGNYQSFSGTELSVKAGDYAEINVVSSGTKMYIRAV